MWQGKQESEISRLEPWRGTAAAACSTVASERRPDQHWVQNPKCMDWLELLAFRDGYLRNAAFKGSWRRAFMRRETHIHTAHTQKGPPQSRGALASQSSVLSLRGIFYFIILQIHTWDHFSKILSKCDKMLKEQIYFQKNRLGSFLPWFKGTFLSE